MHSTNAAHTVFALALVGSGLLLLLHGDLGATGEAWRMGPSAHTALGYLRVAVFIACGAGLLWRRTAAYAARALLGYELLWMLAFKLREVAAAPLSGLPYESWAESAVMIAASWILYAGLTKGMDKMHMRFATGATGIRIACVFYGLAMLGFGQAHFTYLDLTAPLVPAWLPWHVAWAYGFGATYIGAGVGVLGGLCARWAATLSAVQMSLFTMLVWVPVVASPHADAGQWGEFTGSLLFALAGWVVADSYRATPWFAVQPNGLRAT